MTKQSTTHLILDEAREPDVTHPYRKHLQAQLELVGQQLGLGLGLGGVVRQEIGTNVEQNLYLSCNIGNRESTENTTGNASEDESSSIWFPMGTDNIHVSQVGSGGEPTWFR